MSSQIPGQSLPVIPGQPWRPAVSNVSQPLYGQIQPATTGQSAIYRPATSAASASQIYPQVPHAAVPGMPPSGQHSYKLLYFLFAISLLLNIRLFLLLQLLL